MKPILIIIFNLALALSALSQSIEQTFHLAEKQFNNNEYALARNNYNRVLFFSQDSIIKGLAVYKLAQCYFLEKDIEKAKYFFDQAFFSAPNDSLRNESLFQKVLCYYVESRYFEALSEAIGINVHTLLEKKRKHLFLASIYYQLEDFPKAEKEFLALAEDSNSQKKVNALFYEVNRIHSRSCKKTKWMSIFLPGLGQFYNGEIISGLSSFTINTGLIILFSVVSIHYSVLDAGLSVAPWFYRYYLGGAKNAQRGCERKKDKKQVEILNTLLQELTPPQIRK